MTLNLDALTRVLYACRPLDTSVLARSFFALKWHRTLLGCTAFFMLVYITVAFCQKSIKCFRFCAWEQPEVAVVR